MKTFAEVLSEDYLHPRRLPTGQWLALQRQLFTWGLYVIEDGDWAGWRCRFCYETAPEAMAALIAWDGVGDDPPGLWVKQKGRDSAGRWVDRLNPRLAEDGEHD